MKYLLMADRWEDHGDVEAEPILASVEGGTLRLELDDGQILDVQVADIALAMAFDGQDQVAA